MSFILTAIGLLLLAISLGGVALGLYMAADQKTRARGWLFAVSGCRRLAASSGVLMRDVVTFTVGLLCFLVAGTVFALQGDRPTSHQARERPTWQEARGRQTPRRREDHQRERSPGPGRRLLSTLRLRSVSTLRLRPPLVSTAPPFGRRFAQASSRSRARALTLPPQAAVRCTLQSWPNVLTASPEGEALLTSEGASLSVLIGAWRRC